MLHGNVLIAHFLEHAFCLLQSSKRIVAQIGLLPRHFGIRIYNLFQLGIQLLGIHIQLFVDKRNQVIIGLNQRFQQMAGLNGLLSIT